MADEFGRATGGSQPFRLHAVSVGVPDYPAETGLARPWPAEYSLQVDVAPTGQVLIHGDADGLRGLATPLLALAQDGVPAGYHADLDDLYRELDQGSAPLTILRD